MEDQNLDPPANFLHVCIVWYYYMQSTQQKRPSQTDYTLISRVDNKIATYLTVVVYFDLIAV